MAQVARYTPQMIAQYEQAGYWTSEYPVDFWEQNAQRFPDREALVCGTQRYSWASAAKAIDQLALGLVDCGLIKDDVLGLQAPNSATLLLLRLAAEKAGIISLLIPPTFSRAEVGAIVRGIRLRGVVLSNSDRALELADVYQEKAESSIRLFSIGEPVLPFAINIESWLTSSNLLNEPRGVPKRRSFGPYEYAAIVTTSGTTGTPRFVEHTACARAAAGRVYIDRLKLTDEDVIAGMVSIFAGNCDLVVYHTAPQVGAKIVLMDRYDPGQACRIIESERVTCAVFVPTLLHRLLAYEGLGRHDLSSLRIVTSFGAVLAPETAIAVERVLGVKVIQGHYCPVKS